MMASPGLFVGQQSRQLHLTGLNHPQAQPTVLPISSSACLSLLNNSPPAVWSKNITPTVSFCWIDFPFLTFPAFRYLLLLDPTSTTCLDSSCLSSSCPFPYCSFLELDQSHSLASSSWKDHSSYQLECSSQQFGYFWPHLTFCFQVTLSSSIFFILLPLALDFAPS